MNNFEIYHDQGEIALNLYFSCLLEATTRISKNVYIPPAAANKNSDGFETIFCCHLIQLDAKKEEL